MKILACLNLSLLFVFSVSAQPSAYDTASDSAYTGGWNSGTDGGYGFGSWSFVVSGNSGNYIGTTGQGADSFGLWSENGGSFIAERTFDSSLSAGQTFSIKLGHTSNISGSIGLALCNGGTEVIRLRFVGGASNWVLNDGGNDFNAGQNYAANTSLMFSFTYNGGSSYSYTFGSGSGNNYTATSDISSINKIKIFNFDQGSSENFGFNELQINPSTTSSGVDLRAYQAADGVYVEFVAYDVEADGGIQLALMDDAGRALWTGTAAVKAGPQATARFPVPGLELGGSYHFKVRDEVGKWWDAPGVTVQPFAAQMVSASPAGITLSFDSLPDRTYEVQWCPALGSPWQKVGEVTARSARTEVTLPHPDPANSAGFFRFLQQ